MMMMVFILTKLTNIFDFRKHRKAQEHEDALLASLWQFHAQLFVTQIRSIYPY